MKTWQAVLLALGAAIVSAAISDAKQERPERPMRQWQLGWVGPAERDGDDAARRVRLDVFDTEGVCLYVVSGYHRYVETNGQDDAVAIGLAAAVTAVPKTQLPKGAGCQ